MSKIFRRKLPRILLFFLGLWIVLSAASWLFFPKALTKEAGMLHTSFETYLAEPKQSIDVLFLGDSVPLCGITPPVVWNESGIPSFVCAEAATALPDMESFLRSFLKKQSPKVVMLEMDTYYFDFTPSDVFQTKLEDAFPIFAFHDNWKTVPLAKMLPSPDVSPSIEKGYHIWKAIAPADNAPYMIFTDEEAAYLPAQNKILKHIQRICEKRNIQLILFSAPNARHHNYRKHNTFTRVAEELDLPYIDLNLRLDEVGIDWTMDTADWGDHLNCQGAEKLSKYLAHFLSSLDCLTDRRAEPEYQSWNETYIAYQKKLDSIETVVKPARES